jgi:hypothetical protein
MPFLQDLIHKIEVAGGVRYIRYALAFLVAALLIIAYNLRVAKNLGTQEAMDAAQLGRNLADGKGYTTSFVRPFSMHLISKHNQASGKASDLPQIKGAHPDIANPPVYPVVLAGLMKVLPFKFDLSTSKAFWSTSGRFWRYQPDFLIQWFNEVLFLIVIALTYFWARRMFDFAIASTSAIVLFGSEVLWRFSASGLSTMLLSLIFVGIVWCLTLLQNEVLEPKGGSGRLILFAAMIGLLVGLGGLTRYGFGWLILPTLLVVALFGGGRRLALSLTVLAVFAAVLTPWMVRNYQVSGTFFGTAGYDLWKGSVSGFPGYQLERSLAPDIQFSFRAIWMKLLINSRLILQSEFFTFGGGWITSLFLVGLLVGFRNPVIRRVRYFALGSLGILFVVQALTRTQLSEEAPGINSENFLVLLLPLAVVYAVSLFYLLLDQIEVPVKQLRFAIWGLLIALAYLPLFFAVMPPRNSPIAYPPYYPPSIQQAAVCFRESELMMSDVPWAVAWYGQRQCVWLTLNAFDDPADSTDKEHFFAINDLLKPISGLYLTSEAMDLRLQSQIVRAGTYSWGSLILNTMLRKEVPTPFPLRTVHPDYLREQQLFLSDWKRWKTAD